MAPSNICALESKSSSAPGGATLEGGILSNPLLHGGQYYTVDMTLNTSTEPAELSVSGFSELSSANEDGASTQIDNVLTIPSLFVDNVDYWAQFELISTESGTFSLIAADINDDDDDGVLDDSDSSPYDASDS